MNQSIQSLRYLVLGHKGFLGQSICDSLINNQSLVTTVPVRINKKNVEEIALKYFSKDTIVVNCIASGVTPFSSDENIARFTNAQLLESLLKCFIKSAALKFINFGTLYEIDNEIEAIPERYAYVDSKTLGSHITKNFGAMDSRIKLVYLPTILGQNQPEGRFFVDFVKSAFLNLPFRIHHPNSLIKIATCGSLFDYLCTVITDLNNTVFRMPADAIMTVEEFSKLLNLLLIKNGYPAVHVILNEQIQLKRSVSKFNEDFIKEIEKIMIFIAGKRA